MSFVDDVKDAIRDAFRGGGGESSGSSNDNDRYYDPYEDEDLWGDEGYQAGYGTEHWGGGGDNRDDQYYDPYEDPELWGEQGYQPGYGVEHWGESEEATPTPSFRQAVLNNAAVLTELVGETLGGGQPGTDLLQSSLASVAGAASLGLEAIRNAARFAYDPLGQMPAQSQYAEIDNTVDKMQRELEAFQRDFNAAALSPETQKAMADSAITGDFIDAVMTGDFSKLSLGPDPSVFGVAANISTQAAATLAPFMGATRAIGIATGAAMAGGAGGQQARDDIQQEYNAGRLQQTAQFQELLSEGLTEQGALEATKDAAAITATAIAGFVGGGSTDVLTKGVRSAIAKGLNNGSLVKGALAITADIATVGAIEGMTEVAETALARAGVNAQFGTETKIGTGTFGDLVQGAVTGAALRGASVADIAASGTSPGVDTSAPGAPTPPVSGDILPPDVPGTAMAVLTNRTAPALSQIELTYDPNTDSFSVAQKPQDQLFNQVQEVLALPDLSNEKKADLFEKNIKNFDLTPEQKAEVVRMVHGDPGTGNIFATETEINDIADFLGVDTGGRGAGEILNDISQAVGDTNIFDVAGGARIVQERTTGALKVPLFRAYDSQGRLIHQATSRASLENFLRTNNFAIQEGGVQPETVAPPIDRDVFDDIGREPTIDDVVRESPRPDFETRPTRPDVLPPLGVQPETTGPDIDFDVFPDIGRPSPRADFGQPTGPARQDTPYLDWLESVREREADLEVELPPLEPPAQLPAVVQPETTGPDIDFDVFPDIGRPSPRADFEMRDVTPGAEIQPELTPSVPQGTDIVDVEVVSETPPAPADTYTVQEFIGGRGVPEYNVLKNGVQHIRFRTVDEVNDYVTKRTGKPPQIQFLPAKPAPAAPTYRLVAVEGGRAPTPKNPRGVVYDVLKDGKRDKRFTSWNSAETYYRSLTGTDPDPDIRVPFATTTPTVTPSPTVTPRPETGPKETPPTPPAPPPAPPGPPPAPPIATPVVTPPSPPPPEEDLLEDEVQEPPVVPPQPEYRGTIAPQRFGMRPVVSPRYQPLGIAGLYQYSPQLVGGVSTYEMQYPGGPGPVPVAPTYGLTPPQAAIGGGIGTQTARQLAERYNAQQRRIQAGLMAGEQLMSGDDLV